MPKFCAPYHKNLIWRHFQSLTERLKDGRFRFDRADLERPDVGVDSIAEEGLNGLSVRGGKVGDHSQVDASASESFQSLQDIIEEAHGGNFLPYLLCNCCRIC